MLQCDAVRAWLAVLCSIAVAAAIHSRRRQGRRGRLPPLADGGHPRSCRLISYGLVVLVCHTVANLLTEKVFTDKGFRFPIIIGASQFALLTCVPILMEAWLEGPRGPLHRLLCEVREAPMEIALPALCGLSMATHHCSGLASNVWINFTTNMIFSAARLPSVLIVGALFRLRGQQPPVALSTYMWSLCVAAGLLLFSHAERKADSPFSWVGLVLVSINLLMGAVTFNLQDCLLKRRRRAQKDRGLSNTRCIHQFMILQYASAAIITFLAAWGFGEFQEFRRWSEESGHGVLFRLAPILVEAVFNATGVAALLHVTAEFDAARASIVTSTRKACTFVLSFFFFPKPFTSFHACGTLVTVAGSFGVHRSLE